MAESLHEMAKRMCKGRTCEGCPCAFPGGCWIDVLRVGFDTAKAESGIRAWAAANPVKSYKDDFFEKFPNAPRGGKGYEQYPTANLYTVYPVCKEKDKEFYADTSDRDAWDKPLGYWDAPLGAWGEKEKDDA